MQSRWVRYSRGILIACALAFIVTAFTGCDVIMWGTVDVAGPVDTAMITVEVDGQKVWAGLCEDGEFFGRTLTSGEGGVRVSAHLVEVDGKRLGAELSAYEPEYTPGAHLEVNLFTTLVDRYRLAYNVSHEEALEAVKRHLGLPMGLNYAEQLHQEAMHEHLDPALFMRAAEAAGGLDAYLDMLVLERIPDKTAHTQLSALYGGESKGSFYKDLAVSAAEAAGTSLGTQTAGFLLKKFGLATDPDPNKEVLDALQAQNEQLQSIEDELSVVKQELSRLERQLEQDIVDLLFDSSQQPVRDAINNLDALVKRLNVNYTVDKAKSDNPLDPHAFGVSIISNNASTQNDVPHMLVTIHGNVMPDPVTGKSGALGRYALSLNAGNGKKDVLALYKTFEAYFGKILAYQYRAFGLVTEAIHVLAEGDNSEVQFNSVATYRDEVFQDYIDDEVAEFMRWVDYLVISNADYVSEMVNPHQFLPDDTGTVYQRADFIAQQFSTQYPKGITVRVVGQPREVDAFAKGSRQVMLQKYYGSMWYNLTPVYHKVYNLQSSDFYVNKPPAWAKPYVQWHSKYTGWDPDPKNLNGVSTTNVSVATFVHKPGDYQNAEPPGAPRDWERGCWGMLSSDGMLFGHGRFEHGRYVPGKVKDMFGYYSFGQTDDGSYAYSLSTENDPNAAPFGFHLFGVRYTPSLSHFMCYRGEKKLSPETSNWARGTYGPETLLKMTFQTDIGNVKVTTHNHCSGFYCWSDYQYELTHLITMTEELNYTFEHPSNESWRVVTEGTVKGRYQGTDWNIHTWARLYITMAGSDYKEVATLTPFQEGDYKCASGSACVDIDPDSENQTLKLKGRLSGHIDETYEAYQDEPSFTADAVFQSTKVLFELKEY